MKLLVVIHSKVLQNAIFPLKHVPIINMFKSSHLAGHARITNPKVLHVGLQIRLNGQTNGATTKGE